MRLLIKFHLCGNLTNLRGQNNISVSKKWYGSDVYYSELTFHSDNLFGCVSMIKKKYCIFNKQYSKTDYLVLKERIIEHMKKTKE